MFFRASEKKLGDGAKLGVQLYLLNSEGNILTSAGYQVRPPFLVHHVSRHS